MTEPITLYFLVERVSRMREAQRHCEDLNSEYNRRQVVPIQHEVDALLIKANNIRLYPDLLRFVEQVGAMRKAQSAYGMVAEAERLVLESSVDKSVDHFTQMAKSLAPTLEAHNSKLGKKK